MLIVRHNQHLCACSEGCVGVTVEANVAAELDEGCEGEEEASSTVDMQCQSRGNRIE